MKTSYRIIKLTSGEEIIAKMKGSDDKKMTVERPMVFRSTQAFDILGNQKEVTFLKNWLGYSNEIQAKISKESILTILKPDSDVIVLYDKEKEREDTKDSPTKFNMGGLGDMVNGKKPPTSKLDDIIKNEENFSPDDYLKKFGFDPDQISNIMDQFFGEPNPDEMIDEKEIVNLNISFDAKIIKTLVDNDIIPPEYLLNLIEKFENRETISDDFTGDEKEREDFGNKWSDWNQDPNSDDYS